MGRPKKKDIVAAIMKLRITRDGMGASARLLRLIDDEEANRRAMEMEGAAAIVGIWIEDLRALLQGEKEG